jgi:hypothetical protein
MLTINWDDIRDEAEDKLERPREGCEDVDSCLHLGLGIEFYNLIKCDTM